MPTVQDAVRGHSGVIGFGVAAVAVPIVIRRFGVSWTVVIKAGIKLFLEAELEADSVIVDGLIDATVDTLLDTIASRTGEERQRAGAAELSRFESAVRERAIRTGWDAADRKARYRRSMAKFERRIAQENEHATGPRAVALVQAADWAAHEVAEDHLSEVRAVLHG